MGTGEWCSVKLTKYGNKGCFLIDRKQPVKCKGPDHEKEVLK